MAPKKKKKPSDYLKLERQTLVEKRLKTISFFKSNSNSPQSASCDI